MDILILGGTGAIGIPLVNLLKEAGHKLYVTSRTEKTSVDNLKYIQGNARDNNFLNLLLEKKYDVIIDFMVYGSSEFEGRLEKLLNNTKQYCFFSSSRVYAESSLPLTENSPRLLDVCEDQEYLKTDEYALAKAREEDLLKLSGRDNWTIIRPYITYNEQRLQLGVYEKENWLYRALKGRTIVIPRDIAERKTSFTYGPDVAASIVGLLGNERAYGQMFHVVNTQSVTWRQILEIYVDIIELRTGNRPKVKYVDDSLGLMAVWNPWQIKYDRVYNRIFDNRKIEDILCGYVYKDIQMGVEECLNQFLDDTKWLNINWVYEAWCDKITNEKTPLNEIKGIKNKLRYIKWRYLK